MPKHRKSLPGTVKKAYETTGKLLDALGLGSGEGPRRRRPNYPILSGRLPRRPGFAIPVDVPVAPKRRWWPFRKPDPTWRDYEKAAVAFLVSLGYSGVGAAAAGADGGVDVWVTGTLVGQVKAQQTKVGSPPLQQLYGIASKENVQSLFFSKSGYSKPATQWANSVEMPLFRVSYRDDGFVVDPVNSSAKRFVAVGA